MHHHIHGSFYVCKGDRRPFLFEPEFDGNWALISNELIDWLMLNKIDVVLKFALSLLRIPDHDILPTPIISYHHGDPQKYRGRPAGFYEMIFNEPSCGQIVQILKNKLDGGNVIAFGEVRVSMESYKKTMLSCYRLSKYLIIPALNSIKSSNTIAFPSVRSNYRLPSNLMVVKFVIKMYKAALGRILYGAF
jgi:hypothetical protein